ncbi:unnamed protein product [Arctia plantaginis]|uniref:G domain-containing protein n=1 Tax=Arctia plantaginis TaxID=874455 RepID=A0A8S0ZMG5_ARCPL|nr:unnamed protein product [Arctia plantaginis]
MPCRYLAPGLRDVWTCDRKTNLKMPPKKVEEPEKKPLIGRVGTNLKVGIVGVPNVGKSTFFNVLTKSQAAAENFPFCTIDPNENKYFFILCHFFSMYSMLQAKATAQMAEWFKQ